MLVLGAGMLAWRSAFSQGSDITGTWSGVLQLGSQGLRLRFEIGADGKGSIYSLDQDPAPIPLKVSSADPQKLRIEARSIRGRFEGRLTSADRIDGTWKQGVDTPLVLLRGEAGFIVSAAEPLTQDLLEKLRRDAHSPALVAAAMRGDQRRFWVTGQREIGEQQRVTQTDRWHLGSITKSFTATLVGRLVEAGKLSFDDTVGRLLADVAPKMRATYRGASFRHLLSHRAGLPGNLGMVKFSSFLVRGERDLREQRRDWARYALAMKPLGALESTYEYSNNGYVVAGAMLEAALDDTWESLMRRHVFEPLGLASAGFGPPKGEGGQPVGHIEDGNARLLNLLGTNLLKPLPADSIQADNPQALGPAGTVHMNLDDVLTYLAAHRDRTAFLQPDTWRTLHTPPFGGDYAMGWTKQRDGSLWHNGSNTRWYAELGFDTERRVSAVAATNEARLGAQHAVGKALRSAMASTPT